MRDAVSKTWDAIEEDTDGLWPPRAGAQMLACAQGTCAYKHMNTYISHIHVDKENISKCVGFPSEWSRLLHSHSDSKFSKNFFSFLLTWEGGCYLKEYIY